MIMLVTPIYSQGLKWQRLLAGDGQTRIENTAGSAAIVAAMIQPGVCVVSDQIDGDLSSFITTLRRFAVHTEVIVIAFKFNQEEGKKALRAGAFIYVGPDVSPERFSAMVRAARQTGQPVHEISPTLH